MAEREVNVRLGSSEPCAAKVVLDGDVPPVMGAESVTGIKQDFVEGCSVMLIGLKGAPELNGRQGKLGTYDEPAGRWEVLLHSSMLNAPLANMQMELNNSRTVKVRPTNLRRYDQLTEKDLEAHGYAADHDQDVRTLTPSQRTDVDHLMREFVEDMMGLYAEPPRAPACMKDGTCRMVKEPQLGIVSSKAAGGKAEVFRVPVREGSGVEGFLYFCKTSGGGGHATVTCSFRKLATEDQGVYDFAQQAPS